MNLDVAERIAILIGYADGGCPSCVHDLVEQANELFPEYRFSVPDKSQRERGRIIVEVHQCQHGENGSGS